MKPRVFLSLLPVFLAVLMVAGTRSANAADLGISVGIGGHREFRHNSYTTVDPSYSTWYPNDGTTYVYPSTGTTYVTPYVYSTPSVEFNSWYGNGYRNHSGSYGGGHGYNGGYSSGGHGGSGHGGRK